MVQSFEHVPVLRDEIVSLFLPVPPGLLVDATVGGGGHSAALLAAYPGLRVIGLDRDAVALAAAAERLAPFGDRVSLIHAAFSALPDVTSEPLSGVLFDLGVSSPQLDQADRGFSYRADAPIDMRMDRSMGKTAAQLVNELPVAALADLFRENGEGRMSGRIAAGHRGGPPAYLYSRTGRRRRGRRASRHPAARSPRQESVPSPADCRK